MRWATALTQMNPEPRYSYVSPTEGLTCGSRLMSARASTAMIMKTVA